MFRLLEIELIKSLKFKAIWWLGLVYFVVMATILFGVETFINEIVSDAGSNLPIQIPGLSLYSLPDAWHNLTYLASFLKIFLAVISIILITNEFNYKTVKQQIINGLSRAESYWSKVILLVLIALFATVVIALLILVLGFIHTETWSIGVVFTKISFLFAYFLELFAYLSFAFLIATLVHRSGFAIGLLLLYGFVVEPIVAYKLPLDYADYLPINAIGNIIQLPNSQLMRLFGIEFQEYIALNDVLISGFWILVFHAIVYWYYQKKDF